MSKLWGGRFTKETNKLVEEVTSSIGFDKQLAKQDIEGSLAHVRMLGECNILSLEDVEKIRNGLLEIASEIDQNKVQFSVENEDIHMNIEKLLIAKIGPVGGKLHTGRSRNDQVATDMHLYLREATQQIIAQLDKVQQSILNVSAANISTVLPGYTHLQRAQPISFAHHLMTYFWMFQRDKERLQDSLKRVNISPLGAGALAGTTYPIDPKLTAGILEFPAVYPNSIDAVSDRDFILEFLACGSILMMHISRLSEELVLWSSQEFAFIELDDSFCTGSSIMPQKKNPDVPELLRGKTGRVYGNLMGLLTVLKGLPLAYNKDMQEDKEGMFDTVKTVQDGLELLAPLIATVQINKARMANAVTNDFSNATDLADYLVRKGLPFRNAHEVIGKMVLYCLEHNKFLLNLSLEEFGTFSELITEDVYQCLDPANVVKMRKSYGGTSPERVEEQIQLARSILEQT